MRYLTLLVLMLAGAAITTQSAVNSQLRGSLHSLMWAVLVSYVVGSLTAGAVLVATSTPLPSAAAIDATRWYQWTGGALGVCYVAVITSSLQRVGAANLFAFVVTGQLLTALAYDQFGLGRASFSVGKLVGVLCLATGAYLLNRP
jgi:transporter family-2 protein